MKKQDIKDMVNQMISISMETFELSFDDSTISEEDKQYAYRLFSKQSIIFKNKIKDSYYTNQADVTKMVNYAKSKENDLL